MRLLALPLLITFAVWVNAQELNTFSNGEVADAGKINQNFGVLSDDILRLQLEVAPGHLTTETVDCSTDPAALNKSLTRNASVHNLKLIVAGECLLDDASRDLQLRFRVLSIVGDMTSTTILRYPGNVVFEASKSAVLSMSNLTLSADRVGVRILYNSAAFITDVKILTNEGQSNYLLAGNGSYVRVSSSNGDAPQWHTVESAKHSTVEYYANPFALSQFYVGIQSTLSLVGSGIVRGVSCARLSECAVYNFPEQSGDDGALVIEQLSITVGSVFSTYSNPECDVSRKVVPATYLNRVIHSGGQHYLLDFCNPGEPPQEVD